ncbi:MAG: SAV_6107 family HEPN domain-containing protein [Streptosporangiales bacterium]
MARREAQTRLRTRRLGYTAAEYLAQAWRALAEAEDTGRGAGTELRYVAAHLAALRCAAAVLAVRGRPARRRPGTAWAELAETAPELAGWATVFAASARVRSIVESGLHGAVSEHDVAALCATVAEFLVQVEEVCAGQPALPRAS